MKALFPEHQDTTKALESAIQTALILTDEKRNAKWKEDIRSKFHFLPGFVVDKCADALADAVASVAPKSELKRALQPGGLEKLRPKWERDIVAILEKRTETLLKDNLVAGLMTTEQRKAFLEDLVKRSFDILFRDVEKLLAGPKSKLQTLEATKREIQKTMTFWELTAYRIQFFPKQMAMIGLASMYISYSLYQQAKHTVLVLTIVRACSSLLLLLKATASKFWEMISPLASRFAKGLKTLVLPSRKIHRRTSGFRQFFRK